MKERKLESRFQIGDEVTVNYSNAGTLKGGEVTAVTFTDCCVYYDVIIPVDSTSKTSEEVLIRVHSSFVEPVNQTINT